MVYILHLVDSSGAVSGKTDPDFVLIDETNGKVRFDSTDLLSVADNNTLKDTSVTYRIVATDIEGHIESIDFLLNYMTICYVDQVEISINVTTKSRDENGRNK